MTETEVKNFIDKCYEAGKSLYGLESVTHYEIIYAPTTAPFVTENFMILPEEYKINEIGKEEKHRLSHETSHSLFDTSSVDSKNKLEINYEKAVSFSNKNWSNYLINGGIVEGIAESGSDRILLLLGEREIIEEKRKSEKINDEIWAIGCSHLLKDLRKFSKDVYKTSDVFNLIKNALHSKLGSKERKGEAMILKMGIESFLVAPHYYKSYPIFNKLNNSEFQRFVKKWKPRNLDEEISEIDPIPYFLVSYNLAIPKDHEKTIENGIISLLA